MLQTSHVVHVTNYSCHVQYSEKLCKTLNFRNPRTLSEFNGSNLKTVWTFQLSRVVVNRLHMHPSDTIYHVYFLLSPDQQATFITTHSPRFLLHSGLISPTFYVQLLLHTPSMESDFQFYFLMRKQFLQLLYTSTGLNSVFLVAFCWHTGAFNIIHE